VRLNLSKSGLGVSAGVKGLRVGMDAKGRRYLAGGRGGLYFREYAKTSPTTQDGPASGSSGWAWFWFVVALVAVVAAVVVAVR
jgi:hypothetical protein